MDDFGSGILVLTLTGEGDGQHFSVSTGLHEPHRRVLHGEFGTEVSVDPFHGGVAIGSSSLGDQVEDVVRPVLDGGVPATATFFDDNFDYRAVQRIRGPSRSRASFDVMNIRAFVDDDQGSLELTHVLGVDPKVGLERLIDVHSWWHVYERASRPDRRVEGGKLVVVGRDDRPEILLDDFGVFANRGVHVCEKHTEFFEVLTIAVVDNF